MTEIAEIRVFNEANVRVATVYVPAPVATVRVGFIGPKGDKGEDGSGDAYHEHPQLQASAFWTVQHNLNKKPAVTVEDSGGNIIEGDVQYVDNNSLTISFSAPFGGKAYLS